MPGSRRACARNALPVDPVVVRRRLRAIERSLRVLRALRSRGREAFLSDEVVQDRAERHAQLLAQACADGALHILAGTGSAAPETYAEALGALAAAGVIPGPIGARLADAVRLRNILVHGYLDIDHGRLFDELDWIEQTEELAAAIESWLERNVDQS
jgi:uncharacterized protein YutE (UPF0331/DUF86 family)